LAAVKTGEVTHYYGKISVAVVNLSAPLKLGDMIEVVGKHTDLRQKVDSMQINHQDIKGAKSGQEVALKMAGRVRQGDTIYRVAEGE